MDGKKKTTQSQGLPEAVKGTIAVMLTALIVVIITMLFARGLFISNASDADRKTGWLTSTEPLETTAATTKQKVTETKKENYNQKKRGRSVSERRRRTWRSYGHDGSQRSISSPSADVKLRKPAGNTSGSDC